jgi:hypothetical protein
MKNAIAKEMSIGACCEPGPFSLKNGAPPGTIGLISKRRRPNISNGIISPVNL